MGMLNNVATVAKNVKDVLDYLNKIEQKLSDIDPKLSKMTRDTSGVKGSKGNVGKSSPRVLGTDTAKFSSESMNNIIDQHLGHIREANNNYQRASLTMGALSAAGNAVAGITKASFSMMPDVSGVVGRATSYYGAGLASSGGNRQAIASATFRGLRGGLTAPGSDAAVAQYLSATGVNFSSNPQSQYMQTVGSIGNLAKYMNMDNGAAAQAMTGFYSGKGSRQLMQTLGIFTSDPRTGKTRSPGAIMSDIGNRLSNGRKLTVQGVNDSFFRGNLGVDLKGIGLSDDQQQIMKQFLIEKAKGNTMDLSNNKTMEKLAKQAGVNPQAALQAINSSNTSAMQNAESSYLKGIQDAAPLINSMNEAMKGFVGTMGGVNSALATLQGSNSTAGLLGAAGSAVNGIAQIGGNLALMKMAGGKLGGFGGGVLGKVTGMGGRLIKGGLYSAGGQIAGAVAKPAMKALGANNQWANAGSGALQGAGIGAGIGSLFGPGPGTAIGAGVGAAAGGLMGYFGGGGGNTAPNNDNPSKTDASGVWLTYPVRSGFSLGAGWHAQGDYWGSGGHGGLDFFCDKVPVYASASGTISGVEYSDGLGKHVRINHGNGYTTVYAHFSSVSVTKGQKVNQGDQIGISGNSGKDAKGNPVGKHVHLALCTGNGKFAAGAIDPTPHLKNGFPTKWSASNQKGTAAPDGAADSVQASNSVSSSAQNTNTVPAAYAPQTAQASNLVNTNMSGISAGNSGGLLDNSSSSSKQQTSVLAALKKAGFNGEGLSTAAAIALASSNGNAKLHTRVGSQDKYGLFQIDFAGKNATSIKEKYALKNTEQALDPITNAKIAFDMSDKGTNWTKFDAYTSEKYKKYITGVPSAKNGRSYVANDGPINVHAGEAILTSEQADVWRDAIKTSYASKSSGANISINVNVLQASEAEAKRLATMVKNYLEEDKLTSNMRSF